MLCSHLLPLIPMVITHIFFHQIFRDEPDCRPKPMPSRPQPGSLFPSSPRKFLWKSGRPEKEVTVTTSVTILFLSFLVLSSYPFQLEIPHFNYVSELFEEVDLDTFLKEDQATLTRRGKQSVAHVVGEL